MQIHVDDVRRLMKLSNILDRPDLDFSQNLPELENNLRELFDIDFLALALWNKRSKKYYRSICSGRDASITVAYENYFQFLDPFRHARATRPNRGTCLARMIDHNNLKDTAYYNDHLRRFGLEDCVEVGLFSSGEYIGDLRLWRGKSKNPFDVAEEKMIDLMVPNLLNAFPRAWPSVLPGERTVVKNSRTTSFHLTGRESEVLSLIMAGQSDKEVARNLGISYWTVRSHVSSLLRKTDNTSRTGLVGNFVTSGARH